MEIIKVAIADDHKIFRTGVMQSLKHYSYIKFVFEASNGEELLEKMNHQVPDVILCDLKMPVKDGISATTIIAKTYPNVKVIILTMHEDERFVGHLMDCGASGYLLKTTEPTEIKNAIVNVVEKGFYLTAFVNKILLKKKYSKYKSSQNLDDTISITDKEKEILTLVCMEYTAHEIAEKMGISSRTVESTKDKLMERFGVRNSIGLVFYAIKNSLIS